MRFHEIDSGSDILIYYSQVYNPFGYVRFAVEEDKDWLEKFEHFSIATATVAIPFHVLTAMSTGGYWANLPPGASFRAASMKKFTHQMMYNISRNAFVAGSRIPSSISGPAVLAAPMVLGYAATSVAIENAPEHERSSLWRSVSQALAGTGPGAGSWSP